MLNQVWCDHRNQNTSPLFTTNFVFSFMHHYIVIPRDKLSKTEGTCTDLSHVSSFYYLSPIFLPNNAIKIPYSPSKCLMLAWFVSGHYLPCYFVIIEQYYTYHNRANAKIKPQFESVFNTFAHLLSDTS